MKNTLKIALIIVIVIILLVILWKLSRGVKKFVKKQKFKDTEVKYEDLTKNKERYYAIAQRIYEALDGLGTDDDTLNAIIPMLSDEEKKMVFNQFNKVLKDKDDLDDGNLIDWLIDDDREDLAVLFLNLGMKPID